MDKVHSVLQLPIYTYSNEWVLVGLPEGDYLPLYMIDPESNLGYITSKTRILMQCTWKIDFM